MKHNPNVAVKLRISEGTRKGLRRSAVKRQCPKCKRKAALRHKDEPGQRITWCGYCDYGMLTWTV